MRTLTKSVLMAMLAAGLVGCGAVPKTSDPSTPVPTDPAEVQRPAPALATIDANRPMLRGVWADSWGEGMLTREQCEQFVADVRAANLNAIFPEVRKVGDAYYLGGFEPRASNLEDDDFDPLGYLIELCHDTSDGKQYIQVHAWLVTLRLWKTELGEPPVGHLFAEHPDTVMSTADGETVGGTSMFADPGHPMTQEWTARVFRGLVEQYPVDGIHHDYVRYPEFDEDWGHNPVSVERFRRWTGFEGDVPAAEDPRWQGWRRDQVAAVVRRVYAEVMEARPSVAVSAATVNWSLEMDPWEWVESKPRLKAHQDWPRFMAEGSLDMNVLMNYAPQARQPDRFPDWGSLAMRTRADRWGVIGPGIYLNPIEDSFGQIRDAVAMDADGIVLYSYRGTNNEGKPHSEFYRRLAEEVFTEKVDVPEIPWKANPRQGLIIGRVTDGEAWADGALVTLNGGGEYIQRADGAGFYAFLRVDAGEHTVQVHDPRGVLRETVTVTAGKVSRADFELSGLGE